MSNIITLEAPYLSKPYDKRYVIADKETGKILDDAQGYGYRSPQKAYVTYSYKNRDKSKDKEKKEKEKHIRSRMQEHEGFVQFMDRVAFEIAKGSSESNDKFDAKLVKKMLKDYNLNPDFTARELIRVWRKG